MPDPFITAAELSDYLGRDVDSEPAADLAVEFACDACRDYVGQTLTAGSSSVTLNGTGTDALLLPQSPVGSVSSVEVLDSEGSFQTAGAADFSVSGDGVLYATNTAGTATFGSCWPRGRQNVRVGYSHGNGTADLARSIRGVALTLAARFLVQGVAAAEQVGEVNVRYAAESTALMPTERIILDGYRRHHGGS